MYIYKFRDPVTGENGTLYEGTAAEIASLDKTGFSSLIRLRESDTGNEGFWNGTAVQYDVTGHATDGALAVIVVQDGGNTYIAEAMPGADATAAVWRAQKVDASGNVTWADGNGNFNNTPGVAGASLSGLVYS